MRKDKRGGCGCGGGGGGGGELMKALQYHILNCNTKEATAACFRQH